MNDSSDLKRSCLAAAVMVLAFSSIRAEPAAGADFHWDGTCETADWYQICGTPDQCASNPDKWWTYNNWGELACGPGTPFPGATDNVFCPAGSIELMDAATIDMLTIDPGGALTVHNYPHQLAVGTAVTNHGHLVMVNGGELSAGNFDVDNTGTITIAYGGLYGGGALRCSANLGLTGIGELVFDGAGLILGPGTLTNAPGHTIHGYGGMIEAPLANEGTVDADVPNYWLELTGGPKTNVGTIKATNGAHLDLYTAVVQTGAGEMLADGVNSQIRLKNGSAITGGVLDTANDGLFYGVGGTTAFTLTDVSNQGSILVADGATLTINGSSLTNTGVIELRYGGGSGGAHLVFDSPMPVDGTGDIFINDGDIDTAPGVTVTNTATHTLKGRNGSIFADMVNEGTITAEYPPYAVSVGDKPKTNNGTMVAKNGAKLDIITTVNQGATGTVLADGTGSQVRLGNGASIVGGTLETVNDGEFTVNGGTTAAALTDVTILGRVSAADGATLAVSGSAITNDGVIGLYYGGGSGGAHLRIDESMSLQGVGEVFVSDGDIDTLPGAVLTNAATHTIKGRNGSIFADMVNEGTITAEYPPYTLSLTDKPKTNNGTIIVKNGAKIDIHTAVNQGPTGELVADGTGSLVRLGNGSAILGGILTTANGGLVTLSGGGVTASLSDVSNQGNFRTADGATLAISGGAITNDGTIGVYYGGGSGGGHLRFDTDVTADGTGDIYLDTGDAATAPGVVFTNGVGHTLHGFARPTFSVAMINDGTIRATSPVYWDRRLRLFPQAPGITNNGTIEVLPECFMEINDADLFTQLAGRTTVDGQLAVYGAPFDMQGGELGGTGVIVGSVTNDGGWIEPGSPTGTLQIQGDYEQTAAGGLHIELGGMQAGEFDRLAATGTATVAGELSFETVDGFNPPAGTSFTVLTAATLVGAFDVESGPSHIDVVYNANSVTLVSTRLPGDADLDYDVDLDDYAAIHDCLTGPQGTATTACRAADADGDRDVDLRDFAILQAAFTGR